MIKKIVFLLFHFLLVVGISGLSANPSSSREGTLNDEQIKFFNENGYLVIPNFVSKKECLVLRERMEMLVNGFNRNNKASVFSTINSDQKVTREYFYESAHKISYFYEENAFDEGGELKIPFAKAINRVGHALHRLDPIFSDFSYQEKFLHLIQDLGVEDPDIIQSLYIFKQAKIGGVVKWHQDRTFLFSEPDTTLGVWVPLENVTIDNSCLWVVPGSHKWPLNQRHVRNEDGKMVWETYYDKEWDTSKKVALEMNTGSILLIHGHLVHMSKPNLSKSSRHAYAFHVIDRGAYFPKDNWLCSVGELKLQPWPCKSES